MSRVERPLRGIPVDGRGAGVERPEPDWGRLPLELSASPHLHGRDSTARIMWQVVASLVPVVLAAGWVFGVSAWLVVGAATVGAVGTERVLRGAGPVRDGSAVITGLLLGLTLPPGLPLWMALLGGAFGIGFGKLLFGGLGQNVFNPALVGRAFLQASFPAALTTWPAPNQGFLARIGDTFALPLMAPAVDVVTTATPLGRMKFEGAATPLAELALGMTGGSAGETAGLLIVLGGVYLAVRGYLDWRIPVGIVATVALGSALLNLVDPAFPDPLFMVFSGGLLLGAVYMATDMVTSPVTRRGAWIFAAGIGFLVVLIRVWGGLPEGVMYAILLMNAMAPFIDRATQPRVFGTPARRAAGGGAA